MRTRPARKYTGNGRNLRKFKARVNKLKEAFFNFQINKNKALQNIAVDIN